MGTFLCACKKEVQNDICNQLVASGVSNYPSPKGFMCWLLWDLAMLGPDQHCASIQVRKYVSFPAWQLLRQRTAAVSARPRQLPTRTESRSLPTSEFPYRIQRIDLMTVSNANLRIADSPLPSPFPSFRRGRQICFEAGCKKFDIPVDERRVSKSKSSDIFMGC